jgi:hypothetical protein
LGEAVRNVPCKAVILGLGALALGVSDATEGGDDDKDIALTIQVIRIK